MAHIERSRRRQRTRRRSLRSSRGQTLAEFALVLPVLLILALGAIDYGRAYFAYVAVTNAARNGALYASESPESAADASGIRAAAVADLIELDGDSENDAAVSSLTGSDADGNTYARITVDYTFRTLVAWPALPDSINISRSVEVRVAR